jgi:2,4-dienoyl-CoA reductase (NADPH2)
VTLLEARARMGGAFALWAGLPGREAYQLAIDWWQRELERLGIVIRLGARATAADILEHEPDAVIVATGAAYHRGGRGFYSERDIPGYDRDFVYRPEDILSSSILPRGKLVVQDDEGLQTGMGIAELLAGNGAEVEFLTPNFLPLSSRVMAAQEGRAMVRRLRALGGRISTMSFIKEIRDHEVFVADVHSDEVRVISDVDAVVLTTGRVPVNDLEKALDGKVAQLFTIGDALAPRMWGAATFEAHKFARFIGEPGAPASIAEAYFSDDDPMLAPIPGDLQRRSG